MILIVLLIIDYIVHRETDRKEEEMRFGLRIPSIFLMAAFFMTAVGPTDITHAESATTAPDVWKGRILSTSGLVQVKSPGEDAWKVPQKGAWVAQGSDIKTASGATCEIGLGENRSSVVRMKSDSETKLSKMTSEKIRVDLKAGGIYTLVRDLKKGSTFEVVSPAAVATARGTGWEQDMDTIQVFESVVEVTGSEGEKLLVEEGFGVEIENGDVKEPFDLPAESKSEWENFETQAEKSVSEEPTLPADAGYEVSPPAGSEGPVPTEGVTTSETQPLPSSDNQDPLGANPPDDPNSPDPLPDSSDPTGNFDGPSGEGSTADMGWGDSPSAGDGFGDTMDGSAGTGESGFDNFNGDGFGGFEGGFEGPTGSDTTGGSEPFHDIKQEQHDNTLPPPPDPNQPPCSSGYTNC